jgi:flagellar biogenesis protein FliO
MTGTHTTDLHEAEEYRKLKELQRANSEKASKSFENKMKKMWEETQEAIPLYGHPDSRFECL